MVRIHPLTLFGCTDLCTAICCRIVASDIRMMEAFIQWEGRPAACSIDICVTGDGRTLLVEFNDAYARGYYGLPGIF